MFSDFLEFSRYGFKEVGLQKPNLFLTLQHIILHSIEIEIESASEYSLLSDEEFFRKPEVIVCCSVIKNKFLILSSYYSPNISQYIWHLRPEHYLTMY